MSDEQNCNAGQTLAASGLLAAGRKHEIYCFNDGGSPGWMIAMAIADDGRCLAQHCCSHEGYMRHDLGMDGSTWKHENYNAHFGEGNWELVWIDDPKGDARLQQAYKLNQKLAKDEAANSMFGLKCAGHSARCFRQGGCSCGDTDPNKLGCQQ